MTRLEQCSSCVLLNIKGCPEPFCSKCMVSKIPAPACSNVDVCRSSKENISGICPKYQIRDWEI